MKKTCSVLLVLGILAFAGASGAQVLTFDDIPQTVDLNGYGGLNWGNFSAIDATQGNRPGFVVGMMSEYNVAYNGFGLPAEVSSLAGGRFDFIGAYLTGAWNHNLLVQVQGYSDGTLLYDRTVKASAHKAKWFRFDFPGIDRLTFISSGGKPVPRYSQYGAGTMFVMDDFTFDPAGNIVSGVPGAAAAPVPEPAALLLLGSGLLALVGYGKGA